METQREEGRELEGGAGGRERERERERKLCACRLFICKFTGVKPLTE